MPILMMVISFFVLVLLGNLVHSRFGALMVLCGFVFWGCVVVGMLI